MWKRCETIWKRYQKQCNNNIKLKAVWKRCEYNVKSMSKAKSVSNNDNDLENDFKVMWMVGVRRNFVGRWCWRLNSSIRKQSSSRSDSKRWRRDQTALWDSPTNWTCAVQWQISPKSQTNRVKTPRAKVFTVKSKNPKQKWNFFKPNPRFLYPQKPVHCTDRYCWADVGFNVGFSCKRQDNSKKTATSTQENSLFPQTQGSYYPSKTVFLLARLYFTIDLKYLIV